MIRKDIIFFGQKAVLACDLKCSKAFGSAARPRLHHDEKDEDDWEWLSDSQVGDAPEDPGTEEGRDRKPTRPEEVLNKWCARACERSDIAPTEAAIRLSDFSKPVFNKPGKHK